MFTQCTVCCTSVNVMLLMIGIGQLLLFSCHLLLFTTAIPLDDFYDFGEEFGDIIRDDFIGENVILWLTNLGSETITVSKHSSIKSFTACYCSILLVLSISSEGYLQYTLVRI